MPDNTTTQAKPNRPDQKPDERQSNESGNAVLDSDRDVSARPVRSPSDLASDTAAPEPPPDSRDGNYSNDPASKTDKAEE